MLTQSSARIAQVDGSGTARTSLLASVVVFVCVVAPNLVE